MHQSGHCVIGLPIVARIMVVMGCTVEVEQLMKLLFIARQYDPRAAKGQRVPAHAQGNEQHDTPVDHVCIVSARVKPRSMTGQFRSAGGTCR